ncbi:MAG: hypothetical protein MJ173_05640 [Clostridia bacterium]|nr:hypothetical protein [Clostridia bacterium]
MFRDGKIEKTLKPSERKSITEFSSRFGTGPTYEEKMRNKRIVFAVLAAAGVLLLLFLGYFLTDMILKISEAPYTPAAASIISEGIDKWTIFPSIQG